MELSLSALEGQRLTPLLRGRHAPNSALPRLQPCMLNHPHGEGVSRDVMAHSHCVRRSRSPPKTTENAHSHAYKIRVFEESESDLNTPQPPPKGVVATNYWTPTPILQRCFFADLSSLSLLMCMPRSDMIDTMHIVVYLVSTLRLVVQPLHSITCCLRSRLRECLSGSHVARNRTKHSPETCI
jgi:hypothetical protein